MKKDYEKAFEMMKDIVECYETENEILLNRMKYLKYFIKNFGYERPNGKQEFHCFKLIDHLNDIIDGKVSIEINYN